MTYLKFYDKEREEFREAYDERVTDSQAEFIAFKLAKHFGLGGISVNFRGTSSGRGNIYGITLPHNPSVGFICHELAHTYRISRFSDKKHHTKKLMTVIRRFNNYAKKKNYWKEEYERKNAPKPVKPEPTKTQLIEAKISNADEHIRECETKLKRTATILKKWQRRKKTYTTQLTKIKSQVVQIECLTQN